MRPRGICPVVPSACTSGACVKGHAAGLYWAGFHWLGRGVASDVRFICGGLHEMRHARQEGLGRMTRDGQRTAMWVGGGSLRKARSGRQDRRGLSREFSVVHRSERLVGCQGLRWQYDIMWHGIIHPPSSPWFTKTLRSPGDTRTQTNHQRATTRKDTGSARTPVLLARYHGETREEAPVARQRPESICATGPLPHPASFVPRERRAPKNAALLGDQAPGVPCCGGDLKYDAGEPSGAFAWAGRTREAREEKRRGGTSHMVRRQKGSCCLQHASEGPPSRWLGLDWACFLRACEAANNCMRHPSDRVQGYVPDTGFFH